MKTVSILALCGAVAFGGPLQAGKAGCPRHELGARYPWQSNQIMRGDRYGWVILDVNRYGAPTRCRIGNNNFLDVETGMFLCKSFSERWRAPRATASEPDRRKFTRFVLLNGYDHLMADRKARKQWFKANPAERPECYPEPTRPDRLG